MAAADAPANGVHARPQPLPLWGMVCIVAAVLLAYANSLDGALVYDDDRNILANPSIRSLSPPWAPLTGVPGTATIGRPVANWSFAVTYAISDVAPWGHRAGNILIHLAAALTLFALVQRTLLLPPLQERWGKAAWGCALATALLWALHPVQSHAVTYISQRMESLMGLCFFLTLYCAVRGWEGPRRHAWHALAGLCCLVGVGAKEVIVMAPVMVLLYEILLLRRPLWQAVRESWLLYSALACCLGALALLVSTQATEQSGALHPTLNTLDYLRIQSQVLAHYLWVLLWPPAGAFDYVWATPTWRDAAPYMVGILALLSIALWGALRRRAWSYPALWFFMVLAPTSSIMPMMFPAAMYRLYVPSAGVAILAVLAGWWLCSRGMAGEPSKEQRAATAAKLCVGVLCALLGLGTMLQNIRYDNPYLLWNDTLQKNPENYRAANWAGVFLLRANHPRDAVPYFQRTIALNPGHAQAHYNLGIALYIVEQDAEAQPAFQRAVDLDQRFWVSHWWLALSHMRTGDNATATTHLRTLQARGITNSTIEELLGELDAAAPGH